MPQLDLLSWQSVTSGDSSDNSPAEWKIVAVREMGNPEVQSLCDTPEAVSRYWHTFVATSPMYNRDVECFAVLLLNTKNRVRGHHIVSIGSLNEAIVHPREAFRAAVIGAAYSVILMHNHPSGDPTPSSADIAITRRLVEAGKILGITVQDHVVVGYERHASLREAGYL
jgi:DNA repair protein RadC